MEVLGGLGACVGLCVLLSVALIAGLVLLAVSSSRAARRRRQEHMARYWDFAQWAGWRYSPVGGAIWQHHVGPPFGVGARRSASDLFTGEHRGRPFAAFDYSYVVSNGESNAVHRFMVVSVAAPGRHPTLQVALEGMGSRIAELLGSRDLQLESKAFNDRFNIQTSSARFAYDVLSPTTMEWMLADWRFGSWPFRFAGSEVVTWSPGGLNPRQIGPMAAWLCEIVDRTPSFVWNAG